MKSNATNIDFNNIYSSFIVHFYNMSLNIYENIYDITSYKVQDGYE